MGVASTQHSFLCDQFHEYVMSRLSKNPPPASSGGLNVGFLYPEAGPGDVWNWSLKYTETVFSNRVNEIIDMQNEAFAKNLAVVMSYFRGSPEELGNLKARYASFDKGAIWQAINGLLENMHSGLSAMTAIEKTDYFDTFFKKAEHAFPQSQNEYHISFYGAGSNLAGDFNGFLAQMDFIRQFSVEGIDWTKKNNLVVA